MRRAPGAAWAALAAMAAACGGGGGGEAAPTWVDGVAAVVHRSCAECHRPGESGPFPLLTYDDAFRKRAQIARMVERRLMPPWLPTHGDFLDDRRLSPTDVDLVLAWVRAGAPRGDAAAEPAPPRFARGWQLGEPDLVLTAPEPVSVPADGPDRFRNLVIPTGLAELRHVAAVEIRPDSPAVHHAILRLDGTRNARRRDAADAEPGFGGMAMGLARAPDGHFVGWTPGKRVRRNPDGMAWRLWPGNDVVLQLHLTPTGRPESVRPRIGFYFTDQPTRVQPQAVVLYSEDIDIPPGARDHAVADHLVLPVAARLHGIYPHAHYLCRRMMAWATLPDGSRRELLRIDAWDFDWQDDYRYRQPVALPAGTRVEFDYRFDNSADNPANPHSPPRRVRHGLESTDEMATLTLMLVLEDASGAVALELAGAQRAVEKNAADHGSWCRLSAALRDAGQGAGAVAAARQAVARAPGQAAAHLELGASLEQQGDPGAAEPCYLEAIRLDPGQSVARMRLGGILARGGRSAAAIAQFEQALLVHPDLAALRNNLATALFAEGRLAEAEVHYQRTVQLDPDHFAAWFNLGRVLAGLDRAAEARAALARAAVLRPGEPAVQRALDELDRRRAGAQGR